MNTGHKLFRISLCAVAVTLWISTPTFAQQHEEHGEELQEEEHHEGGHDSEAKIPRHADEIVAEILTQDLLIRHYIDTGELTKIHGPAFEARDLAQALEERAEGLTEENEKTLANAVRRIGPAAKELDKYGDAKDATKTKVVYRAFEKAIQDIKSLYPGATPAHYWTCSMHSDVWKVETGQCPKCNMKLVEKGESEHEEHEDEEEHHDEHEDEH